MEGEMDYTEKYIRELRSSTALMRKFAARHLRTYGDARAIAPLVEALSDPEAEVRMAAAETLGRIGDRSVLPGLEKAGQDPNRRVVRMAEQAIKFVLRRHPVEAPPPAAPKASRPADRAAMLEQALDGTGAKIQKRKYGFKITVPRLNRRNQEVRLVYDRSDPDDDILLLVFTVCGPADPDRFRWALRMNVKSAYGSLALWNAGKKGGERFILLVTLLEEETTVEELRKSVLTVAERGDGIEKKLTGGDKY
jgi:HEAT repeat protein